MNDDRTPPLTAAQAPLIYPGNSEQKTEQEPGGDALATLTAADNEKSAAGRESKDALVKGHDVGGTSVNSKWPPLGESVLTVSEARLRLYADHDILLKHRYLQKRCNKGDAGLVCQIVIIPYGQQWEITQSSLDTYAHDNPRKKNAHEVPLDPEDELYAQLKEIAAKKSFDVPGLEKEDDEGVRAAVGDAHDSKPPEDEVKSTELPASAAAALGGADINSMTALYDQIVTQQQSEIKFLREELAKRDDSGIRLLATETLKTLQAIATGNRLAKSEDNKRREEREVVNAEIISSSDDKSDVENNL